MKERISLQDIQQIRSNSVFFDANVWIYLFCPISNAYENVLNKYSRAFGCLCKSGNKIYFDFAVLSEFANVFLNLSFKKYKLTNSLDDSFNLKKNFRLTKEYQETVELIISTIRNKIFKNAHPIQYDFNLSCLESILDNFLSGNQDFNDCHIEYLCHANNLILLTDDADYSAADIPILTGNPRLLGLKL